MMVRDMEQGTKAIAAWMFAAAAAWAHGAGALVPDRQGVLVLLVSSAGDGARERDERLADELAITLGDMATVASSTAPAGFLERTLAEKLGLVREMAARGGSATVAWTETRTDGRVAIHVVTSAGSRTVLRTAEAPGPIPGAEEELALAVRELLRDAVLDPTARVMAPPAPEREPRRVDALATAAGGGGIVGQTGASLQAGGEIGLEVGSARGPFARIGFAALGGPFDSASEREVGGASVEPTVGLGWFRAVGRLAVVPWAAVSSAWTRVSLRAGAGRETSFSWWEPRWSVRLDLRYRLSGGIALVAGVGLDGVPENQVFERESDRAVVWATPFLSWRAALGLSFPLGQ
jgi:hypothetical protein